MIAIIAAIAVISVIATIAVIAIIAIIGTSVDAENAVLCTESVEKTAYNHPVAQIGPLFRGRTKRHSPGRVVPLSRARPAHEEHVLVLSWLLGLKSVRNPRAQQLEGQNTIRSVPNGRYFGLFTGVGVVDSYGYCIA